MIFEFVFVTPSPLKLVKNKDLFSGRRVTSRNGELCCLNLNIRKTTSSKSSLYSSKAQNIVRLLEHLSLGQGQISSVAIKFGKTHGTPGFEVDVLHYKVRSQASKMLTLPKTRRKVRCWCA